MPTLFSYVVEHDGGHAPNPYFRVCTLCRCKFRESSDNPSNLVEKASAGDWVIGTGGANMKKSAGHGRLVYAMQVDEKLTRQQYFLDRRFRNKKPRQYGTYKQKQGDNEHPANRFERDKQFVLVSRHFYYFGRNAIRIPKNKFHALEKRGPGFRYDFSNAYIARFVKWLQRFERGIHGDPCWKKELEDGFKRKGSDTCRSSC